MKTFCCKCSANLEAIDGVGFSYCDRCAKVAGLEIELDQAEAGRNRAERSLRAAKYEQLHKIALMNCESEIELWTDRVSELKLRISELGS